MATTSAPAPSNGLAEPAEPAAPQDRKEQNLPPKSYAKALKESLPPASNFSDSEGANGATATSGLGGKEEPEDDGQWTNLDGTDDQKKIYERHVDGDADGGRITSVKPQDGFEETLRQDQDAAVRQRKKVSAAVQKDVDQDGRLASGRQAGKGWSRSMIRWAPLNIPLQRRLQTAAIIWHAMAIPICISLFFFMCSIPLFWALLIPYLIHALIFDTSFSDGTLSRRSPFLRRSKVWSLFASYYPARLHRTVELSSNKKYIFGYHPHGIISHGAFAAFSTEALGFSELFPGITNTLLTLDSNFRTPLYRDYALAMGLCSVSRESIQNLLSKGGPDGKGEGRAVTIVVGGARESLEAKPRTFRLVLKARKGFVKEAIRMGADLVPVLAFGENDLYDQVDSEQHPWINKFQLAVKKLVGFTVPLFHARGVFNYDVGLLPYRKPVNIVVGRPIQVKQQLGPEKQVDPAYLDEIHALYVQELERIFDTHKDTFAPDRMTELEIVA